MPEPRTRKPTGKVAFPLIQVDGEEKAGKSYLLAALSGSPRVGRSFMVDLGDGTMDEYATLGDYEIIEHNGTFMGVLEQVELAAAVPSDPDRPNLIGLDAGTLLWGLLKAKAERRARSSARARSILEKDPDAEIDVTMPYWNEVKDDWARLLQTLKRFPGIGVVTAQGRYVSKVDANGQPVRGQQEWSTDVEKTTHSWASALVRLHRDPRQALLVGVRSIHVDIPTGGLLLPSTDTLDHLIFDLLGSGGFGPNTATAPTLGVPVAQAKGRVLAAVKRAAENLSEEEAKAEAIRLWKAADLDGKQEVTEAELRLAMPSTAPAPEAPAPAPEEGDQGGGQKAPTPPVVDDPGPGGEEAPTPAPETAPAPETSQEDSQEKVEPAGHVCPDGAVLVLEGQPVSADEAMKYLRGLLKPALVSLAAQVGVATNGKVDDIRERVAEFWGLMDAPFDAPPPAPEETPRGEMDPPNPADLVTLTPRDVADMEGEDVDFFLTLRALPTTGSLGDRRLRLMEYLNRGGDPAFARETPPEEGDLGDPCEECGAPAGVACQPGCSNEGDDLPEVQEVPEGWVEAKCVCGEAVMYEAGNYTKTRTHLDKALDEDHAPEEPF